MTSILDLESEISQAIDKGKQALCLISPDYYKIFFFYSLLPVLIILIIIFIIKYKEFLINYILKIFGKRGYIKIFFRLTNKRIVEKYIKIDKFNCFKIGKRKYTLESMQDFIFGFDKNNFPIFLYDINFILPLTISRKKINAEIANQLKYIESDEINAISMTLDSSILYTVYDKKLMSDLYSISSGEDFRKKVTIAIIIIIAIIVLYYTGLLKEILSYVGIDLPVR